MKTTECWKTMLGTLSVLCLCSLSHGGHPDDMTYAYLTAMGGSCYPWDSCHAFLPIGCRCDPDCERYGDCCVDAFQRERMRERWHPSDWTCSQMSPGMSVAARQHCALGWNGNSVIQRRCDEKGSGSTDVLSIIPVTSTTSGVTYINYFCALCNDDVANATFWDVVVDCEELSRTNPNVTLQYIHDNLEYDPGHKSWGLTLPDDDFTQFHRCSVHYLEKSVVQKYSDLQLRSCNPNAVSTCSPYWRDQNVKQKCLDYQAEMVCGNTTYRNIHCALCNFVNIRTLRCPRREAPKDKPEFSSFHISYNVSSGTSSIGETLKCGPQEIADPFYKRCRSLQCVLPGFSYVDGQCVTSVT